MSRRWIGLAIVLLAMAFACFSRLALDPTSLMVDVDHPSLDHARPFDDSPIGNDLTRLFLPHHLAISRAIENHGHLPLWDDRGFGGRPLVGNPQGGLFYPPTWLAWWSGTPSALGWITIGHLLFSAVGTYRLGRTLGMGEWGCLVAAGCVQASPYVLAQTFEGHYPHVWAACWYPWAFDAVIRLRSGQNSSILALALIVAAMFLAGHPQEGYYLLIALGLWAAWDGVIALFKGQRRQVVWLWGGWALALSLAFGLICVEIIPDAMAQPWCLRMGRLSLRLASRYHIYPSNLLQLFAPGALGQPSDYFGHENYWESVTSIGLVPLVLAIVAISWSNDRRVVRGWFLLVVASLIFASGRQLGLFTLFYQVVPGMNRFRVPARALFLGSLGASMLAGMGVEALLARSNDDRFWARLAGRFGIVALLLMVAIAGQNLSTPSETWKGVRPTTEVDRLGMGLDRLARDHTFLGCLGGISLLIAIGRFRPDHRKTVAISLGLLGLVELSVYGHDLIKTTPADRLLGSDPISKSLLSDRPPGLESPRIRVVDTLYDDLRASHFGFCKTNVNDSFQIQHAADLYESLYHLFDDSRFRPAPNEPRDARQRLQFRQGILDRMGVSLLVSDHLDPEAPWPLVASGTWQNSSFAVHRNPTALPRAYVVPRALPAKEDASILARFLAINPREAVFMPVDPLGPESSLRQPFTPANWTSTDPDRIVLTVETEAPGLLVVADTWMPGWSAQVNGQPRPVLKGNHAQRVVPLSEPGRHEVILTYRAPGLKLGLTLTLATAFLWSSLAILIFVRARSTNL